MDMLPSAQLPAIAEYVGQMLGLRVEVATPSDNFTGSLRFKAPIPTPGEEYCLLFVVPVYYRRTDVQEWRIRGTVSTSIPAQTLATISQYMTMWYESDGNP